MVAQQCATARDIGQAVSSLSDTSQLDLAVQPLQQSVASHAAFNASKFDCYISHITLQNGASIRLILVIMQHKGIKKLVSITVVAMIATSISLRRKLSCSLVFFNQAAWPIWQSAESLQAVSDVRASVVN